MRQHRLKLGVKELGVKELAARPGAICIGPTWQLVTVEAFVVTGPGFTPNLLKTFPYFAHQPHGPTHTGRVHIETVVYFLPVRAGTTGV
ncbi:MAG: hypothetical protein DLM55_12480 [Acidimicrobiales bacterium]|nr:MAG: hypothetical protein DLM55_12480 [Acidimicrobiales bacterium]